MQFLDNSGHIFNLKEYNQNPIGYEYDEQDYIFWFSDSNNNNQLSINNYYAKIINVLIEVDNISNLENTSISNIYNIDLTLESEIFSMIKANSFQIALHQNKSILDYVYINEIDKYQKLSSDQGDEILVIKVSNENKKYIMIPIYILANAKYTGTWMSNILIHVKNSYTNKEVWCPITIGGIFNNEYEALVINSKNMGIKLPKEILKAINGTSFYNKTFNEELYNKKIKEYMINYMGIKGECGNYNSAIKSLKWFGFGDFIEIYKLIETDNEFKTQYIRDFFEINTDIIQAYRHFINTQFIGLKLKLNTEILDDNDNIINEKQNLRNYFWGEGLPILEDLINKSDIKSTDEFLDDQRFKYQSTYFKYSLNELMFKLSCLAYYYQTYFLPIFITLKALNIEYKVYANDYKELNYVHDHIYESIVNTQKKYDIRFPKENFLYFTHQKHVVDNLFNDFTCLNSNKDNYLINDTCLYIPIEFQNGIYFNCILILKDNQLDQVIYKSNFSFINNGNYTYNGFVFYPKMIEELTNNKLYTFVNKSYTLYLNANNYWYEYTFTSKIHEMDVHIGTLEYKYWINDINYCNYIYHLYDKTDENNNITNNTNIIFNFYNKENNEIDTQLDITNYIYSEDFFDSPTKYFSNFSQIDYIDDNQVYFNSYMNDPDFIYVNNTEFGLYQNKIRNYIKKHNLDNIEDQDIFNEEINKFIKNDINQLVNKYQDNINIINNYKYMNNVHLYNLYKKEYSIEDELGNIYDLLKFKSNLRALCDNVLIERTSSLDNTFRITYVNQIKDLVNTKDDYNYYLNEEYNVFNDHLYTTLKEDSVWYFLIERNEFGKIQIQENTTNIPKNAQSIYTIKENKDKKHDIGYLIYKIDKIANTNEMEVDFTKDPIIISMLDEFKYDNINYDIEKNCLYYKINNYNHLLYFKFTPLLKTKENKFVIFSEETYQTLKNSNQIEEVSIYAKLDLHFYEVIKILNLYGYYSESLINNSTTPLCSDFVLNEDNNSATCTLNYLENDGITITQYKKVKLEKSTKLVNYHDLKQISDNQENPLFIETLISNDNPSLYWASFDKNIFDENDKLIKDSELINANKGNLIYSYNDEEIKNIDLENDDNYTFKYINYLCKNITGLSGKYLPCCEFFSSTNSEDKFKICVDIIDKDGNYLDTQEFDNIIDRHHIDYNNFKILELSGDEKQVLMYFKVNNKNNLNTFTVLPHLYKYNEIYKNIEYNPNENLISLYKEFFYKRYSVTLYNNETNEENIIKEIWDSYIEFNNSDEYDMYLMHGPEEINGKDYWYIMFISKNTCNMYNKLIDLNYYKNEIYFKDYLLKHQSTKQLFLINRMRVKYKENIYHFNQNDIIVCSLYNNKMLPTNMNISSKWNIKPISFGSNTSARIYANTNTAIVSITTTNTYDKGYYDLSVKYSLDNNVFNIQEINKKILIE